MQMAEMNRVVLGTTTIIEVSEPSQAGDTSQPSEP